MKIDFRLNNVPVVHTKSINRRTAVQDLLSDTKNVNNGYFLSFTANPAKNMAQTASIAPEYQGILNGVYKLGGLGNVAGEASIAFADKGGMDFRTFVPYYAPQNEDGLIKVRTPIIKDGKQEYWSVPKMAGSTPLLKDGEPVYEQIPAYKFKAVPLDYKLKENEQFVIHEKPVKERPWNTGYKVLEDTGVSGSVKSVSDDLSTMNTTPYKIFKVQGTEVGKTGNPPVYVVHTPELAKFPRAYGGTSAYAGGSFQDAHYAVFSKAVTDAMPKFNSEEFGNFNPGNYWLHDRQAFPVIIEMSEKSAQGDEYWRGIKTHSSFHNPGRDYQGHYKNPIDFMRIIGSEEDLAQLGKNPDDYQFAKDMVAKIEAERSREGGKFSPEEILSKDELARLNEIFKPLYGDFVDETGEYNLCKIPIESVRKNPYNFSAGTVSTTFGKEMKNHNTSEITPGLTKYFASIPTVDIVNGSSARSMRLDIIGDFGRHNGFTEEVKQGFTPLTNEVKASSELLFEAKQSNKKWLIDTIASHAKKGEDALTSLFYSKDAQDNGASVLGSLSGYRDNDVLFVSWGRPDAQKGFPTTLEGILDYFKDSKAPAETKEHAKFIIGAGPWAKDAPDWKTIRQQLKELETIDGGRYSENVCYLNGFFTNRIVACADYSNITSRYEPCGITPLESFAGGAPVISNKTGGSPDFIVPFTKGTPVTNETGFLTRNAYLVNPDVIGAKEGLEGVALDTARREALGKENAKCIEDAVNLFQKHPEEYKKMMTNAVNSKIDWHENITFNGGLSAVERYKENVWSIGADNKILAGEERSLLPLETLKGQISPKPVIKSTNEDIKEAVEPMLQNLKEEIKNIIEPEIQSLKNDISSSNAAKETNSIVSTIKMNKGVAASIIAVGIGCIAIGKAIFDRKAKEKAFDIVEKQKNTSADTAKTLDEKA